LPGPTAHSIFIDEQGEPKLARCAVLFADLLGVRTVSESSPLEGLRQLEHATRRTFRDFLAADSPWPSAFFSDTLVVASPVEAPDEEEAALGGLILQTAALQLNLIRNNWFLRGGIAVGEMYLRDGLVFGPALIEAFDVERSLAVYPRIVLSKDAAASQRKELVYYAQPAESPENLLLLEDDDGVVFIDYLSLLLDEPEQLDPAFLMHRKRVLDGLARHRSDRRVWDKYRWVAEYHNHTCRLLVPGKNHLLVPEVSIQSQFRSFIDDA
jgi:hypothetical protein